MPRRRFMGGARSGPIAIALLLLAGSPARAAARGELARCVDALGDEDVDALSRRLGPELLARQRRARLWFWGWFTTNAGLAIGATAFAFTLAADDPAQRDAYLWGAAGSGAALLLLLAPPLPSAFTARRLGGEGREALARMLDLLERAAEQERASRGWLAHTANGAFALAEGLYLGLRYDDHAGLAVSNALGSLAVAEAQAWSAPRGMTRLRRALADEGVPCIAEYAAAPRPSFHVAASPLGVGFALRF